MKELAEIYEITEYDKFLCHVFAKIIGARRIPRHLQKISKKCYGEKDNLTRYYVHKYRGFSIGKFTYGFEQFYNQAKSIESIGAFCSFAVNVNFTTGNHPLQYITTSPIVYRKRFSMLEEDNLKDFNDKKVIIGNDVWIGRDTTILPGVNIGNGAIIGAGSIVNRDIPDYSIAVGVPAKVIKYRFKPLEIELLNSTKWWEWNDENIRESISLFNDPLEFFSFLEKNKLGIINYCSCTNERSDNCVSRSIKTAEEI